jgi:hypothetical protein
VGELMVIETDARLFIANSIKYDVNLSIFELKNEKLKAEDAKKELVKLICSVNSVANIEGKGRDDFNFQILETAEKIQKDSITMSKQVVQLANKVKISFNAYRVLIRKYSKNVEMADPQLKNNVELVKVLQIFENSWSLAKESFTDETKLK